ncbi:MAG: hypothetical protein IKJ34_03845, partial [Mailhella sp.]|nr:hypothetical protein [Mailhella sp.]
QVAFLSDKGSVSVSRNATQSGSSMPVMPVSSPGTLFCWALFPLHVLFMDTIFFSHSFYYSTIFYTAI